MRSKFKWIFTLLVAFTMQFSFAQQKTVTGVVSDNLGPVAGANVVNQSSKAGTVTDFDGNYSVSAKKGDVLLVSFAGSTQSVTVGDASTYNVSLKAVSLEEVVLEGYKTTTKSTTLVAATTVGSKAVENRANVNVLQSLQGQVAGANISSFSGQPGTNKIDVIIRGVSSISASTDPLYVIDGVPMTQAFFRNLNANEIESVTVLKDAAGTAIYGNRGTNGVVVITTKKGTFKKSFDVKYSSSYGLTEFRGDDYNLPTAVEHLRLQQKGFNEGVASLGGAFANSGTYLGYTLDPANIEAYGVNTNWKDLFFRTGTTTSHDLSFTAGSDNLNNFTSVGYSDQDGIVPTTNFKRFTIRSNFSGKSTNEKFTYGMNFFAAFSKRNQLEQETRGDIDSNVLQNPLTGYLNSPRFVDANSYQNGSQLYADYGNPALDLTPFMLLDLYGKNNAPSFFNEYKTIVTANAAYKIDKYLTLSTNMGGDYADDKRNFAIGPDAYLSIVRADGASQAFHGLEVMNSSAEFSFSITNRLNYKRTFSDKHTLDFSLFNEYLKAHRRVSQFQQIGLNPLTWVPGAGTGYIAYNPATMPTSYRPSVAAARSDAGLVSYFATLDYDFDSKYGVSGSLRRDGSYRFAPENRWGTFYSVAGRWNISNEEFLKGNEWISELKLRVSYGTTGNQNVIGRASTSNVSTLFLGNQLVRDLNSAQTGYANAPSFGVSSFANSDLKWEKTEQSNLGIDFAIKRRLSGSLDIYNKRTVDLYMPADISSANGITALNINNGSLENKGIELGLKFDVLKDTDLKLSVFGNGAYNVSSFRNLGVIDPDGDGIFRVGNSFQYRVGGQLNEYFLVPYAGVNPVNGNLLFLDIDGNVTETPTDADRRTTHKNALPKYTGGFGLNTSYEGFFLDLNFVYAFGAYKFDGDYQNLMDIRNSDLFAVSNDLLDAWTPTNTNSDVPALAATNLDAQDISDRFLRDASYVRLRNLSVGYSVPSKFLDKTLIKSVRFRLQGENLFTFTKWKGFDPESYVTSQTGYYPTPRIYTFGVDVNF